MHAMGLLDDAIREHLELKRRRGADPAEIARMEQEALGPVRRTPRAAPIDDSHEADAPDAGADEPVAPEPAAAEPEPEPVESPVEADASAPEPAAYADPTPAAEPADAPADQPPFDDVEARRREIADQPTTEYRVEDWDDDGDEPPAPGAAAPDEADDEAAPAEDVLEETPDFLQETPEHDRLWFEQRPPRDFDFDD